METDSAGLNRRHQEDLEILQKLLFASAEAQSKNATVKNYNCRFLWVHMRLVTFDLLF